MPIFIGYFILKSYVLPLTVNIQNKQIYTSIKAESEWSEEVLTLEWLCTAIGDAELNQKEVKNGAAVKPKVIDLLALEEIGEDSTPEGEDVASQVR